MIKAIVALDANNLIGAGGKIIWQLSEDMAHFKAKTMGNICIMGRVTWESIPIKFRPLSGRKTIVVTSNAGYEVPDDVLVAPNLEQALALCQNETLVGEFFGKDIYVCGGASLYEAAMPLVEEIEVTEIAKSFPTEGMRELRYFPEIDPVIWYPADFESHKTPDGLIFDFITYTKRQD